MTRTRRSAFLLVLVVALTGCLEDRSFHVDDDIRFIEPVEGDFASSPLLVKWTGGPTKTRSWALFVDRAPIRPGTSIDDLEVQERENLFLSDGQELTLDLVPPRAVAVASRRDRHRLVLVPLDAKGRRVGEEAASVELTVVPG
jgi:hypothetical protein